MSKQNPPDAVNSPQFWEVRITQSRNDVVLHLERLSETMKV